MFVSLPFQQQFTWRKLGYLFFQDSLSYREVLDQNPQWGVTKLPPIGAQLTIQGTNGGGGMTQGTYIAGLPNGISSDTIFPYDTESEYVDALNRYTLQGVVEREKVNGVCIDSVQAITGIQYG
jgi:hypothetical protein